MERLARASALRRLDQLQCYYIAAHRQYQRLLLHDRQHPRLSLSRTSFGEKKHATAGHRPPRNHRTSAAAQEYLERQRLEALREASTELAKRAAAFQAALLHSSQKRGFSKRADTDLATTLTKSLSVNSLATELVKQADRRAQPPPPWAHECARIRGDLQHRSAPVLATTHSSRTDAKRLTRAESAVLEQAAAAELRGGDSAATLLASKFLPNASTCFDWTHWSFMEDRRLEQLRSGPGLSNASSKSGLLAWGANL